MAWVIYVAALATWALLSYATLFEYLFEGTLFARSIAGRPYISDFVNTYNAARLSRYCLAGHRVDVYDPKIQDAWARPLIAPVVAEQPFYLQYPPQFFALALPLSLFSMPVAWFVWNAVWLALIVACIWSLTRDLDRRERLLACVFSLATYPAWLSAELGQPALFIFVCVAGLLHLLVRGRPLAAGLVCSLIVVKLQYLPVFGLIGLLSGRWKFLLGAIAGSVALLLLTAGIVGWQNIISWPAHFISGESSQGVSGVSVHAMQNFRALLANIMHADNAISRGGAAIFLVLCLAWIGRLWWGQTASKLAGDARRTDFLIAFTVLLALISSLHAHVQDFVLVIIAGLLIYRSLRASASCEKVAAGAAQIKPGERKLFKTVVSYPALSWLLFFLQPLVMLIVVPPFLAWAIWTASIVWFYELRRQAVQGDS